MARPERAAAGASAPASVTTLLAGRAAWLLTHPDGDALSFYLTRGWRDAASFVNAAGSPLRWLVRPADG